MPDTLTGRIVSVEQKPTKDPGVTRPYVVLLTKTGLRSSPSTTPRPSASPTKA
jgi:hypothetical protein